MKKKIVMLTMIVCVFVCRFALGQVSDDRYTVGFWRMNSSDFFTTSTREWISDYDVLNPGRGKNMVYGMTADTATWPQLSAAGAGYDGVGEALVYSGGQVSYSFIDGDYGNYENVRIELWFFRQAAGLTSTGETLIGVGDDATDWPWEVRLRQSSGSRVYFYVKTTAGIVQVQNLFEPGVWNKVVAVIDQDLGEASIEITPQGDFSPRSDSVSLTHPVVEAETGRAGRVYMGARGTSTNGVSRPFNGMLDAVKISKVAQYPELFDDARTVALWKMNNDDVFTDNSQTFIKDHDDFTAARGNHLLLPSDPNFTPEVLSDALVFEPVNYAIAPNAWAGYDSVKVDLWFYRSSAELTSYGERLLTAEGAFELRFRNSSGNRVYFYLLNSSAEVTQLHTLIDFNVWNHLVADYDADADLMSLSITPFGGQTTTVTASPGSMRSVNGDLKIGTTRAFQTTVFLDDVQISILGDTCGLWGYSVADINKDCVVDTDDLVEFASYWLESSMPQ